MCRVLLSVTSSQEIVEMDFDWNGRKEDPETEK